MEIGDAIRRDCPDQGQREVARFVTSTMDRATALLQSGLSSREPEDAVYGADCFLDRYQPTRYSGRVMPHASSCFIFFETKCLMLLLLPSLKKEGSYK